MKQVLFVASACVLALAQSASAQSNPYVLNEDFENGAPGWSTSNTPVYKSHISVPGECGNPSSTLALNDGSGICTFGGQIPGAFYSASGPTIRFHENLPMEFLLDYRLDIAAIPYNTSINGTPQGTWEFGVAFFNDGADNDGTWRTWRKVVHPVIDGPSLPGQAFNLSIVSYQDFSYPTAPGGIFYDNFVVRPLGNGTAFCGGDVCPCGNQSASNVVAGCQNSSGKSAWLHGYGDASIALDEVEFVAAGLLPGQPALLFQGFSDVNGGLGSPFGDGLRCVGGAVQRLGVQMADSQGTSTWKNLAASAGWTPGQSPLLQVYYRDSAGGTCGSGFNTTNGYSFSPAP